MIQTINQLFIRYLKKYEQQLRWHHDEADELQTFTFVQLMNDAQYTAFGREHGIFPAIYPWQLRERVPVRDYTAFEPYIRRVIQGEQKVLSPYKPFALAKSAGTTANDSKLIPVSRHHLKFNQQKAAWLSLAALHTQRPGLQIFARKNMLIGGGHYGQYPGSRLELADISALLIRSIPAILKPFYTPDVRTATLPDYAQKIELISKAIASEKSLTMLGGVPTWNLALYRKVLEISGASNLLEVWPNLQAYIHGGVGFAPYKAQFEALIPDDKFVYHEVYNASEGYLAIQDERHRNDLLLLLNNGVFYEFIPFTGNDLPVEQAITLPEVKLHTPYALVITTNGGLYRYLIGDVVQFTSKKPYRVQLIGRTQEYVNAFGEDLILDNAQRALAQACNVHQAEVADYTIAPSYMQIDRKGRHQWFIEFDTAPANVGAFAKTLDELLQKNNSNYAQKRSADLAIENLEVVVLPRGFFMVWLHHRGRTGGQSKVPKLANHRQYAEDLLAMLNNNKTSL